MRFRVRLLFIMLTGTTRRLRVDNGLNKNEGSSVHDPSDEVSEAKAAEAKAAEAKAAEAKAAEAKAAEATGCKNGLAAPDAPTGASDLSNGFAVEAMFTKKYYKLQLYYFSFICVQFQFYSFMRPSL